MREKNNGDLIITDTLSPEQSSILSVLEQCSDKHEDCEFCRHRTSCQKVWDNRVSSYQYKMPEKEVRYSVECFQKIMAQA